MPRYDNVVIRDVRIKKNAASVRDSEGVGDFSSVRQYENISNDAKVDWSGDIVFDESTGDLLLAYNIEALVQNIYHRLITNLGSQPGEPSYGWPFEYLYQLNVVQQKALLPKMVRDIETSLKRDPDIVSVLDVRARIERQDMQTHNVIIEIEIKPKGVSDILEASFGLDIGGTNS